MHLLLRCALLVSPSLNPQVVVLILALVSSARVMKKLKQLRRDQLKLTDARVKATNEALLAIRVVQSNSWEGALGAQIDAIRAQELALIRKTAFLQAYVKFLYFAIQVMVALSTFVTFAGLGGVLRASDIFSCIALFALMQVRNKLVAPLCCENVMICQVSSGQSYGKLNNGRFMHAALPQQYP